jgi:putative copper export protein/methionine-rich copper-binding protein CopC
MSLFYIPKLSIVYGHATPDRYTLEPNSLLEKESFPSKISILFSERPDPKVSYIHVTNSEGSRIDNDDFNITGEIDRRGTVTVNKNLVRDGVYAVSWSTLSLDDGHVAKGTYVVGVGVGSSLPANTAIKNVTDSDTIYSPIISIVKIPIVIGQVYVLGFVFTQIIIWNDIRRQDLSNIIDFILIRRFTNPIIILSIVMAIAATLIPIIQSDIISQTQSEYMKNLSLLYFETANGKVWLIRVISCAIVAFAAYYYGKDVSNQANTHNSTVSRNKRTILLCILLIAELLFIFTNSATSHSSSLATWSQLGIFADFVHSVAVSIWIGGLLYIFYVFFPNVITISKDISGKEQQIVGQPKSILLLILSRFSVISTICVGVVGITGLSLAWLHIDNIDELLLSGYGRTLIVKLSLILPVVVLGGYHQFWISRIIKVSDFERVNEDGPSKTNFRAKFSSVKKTIKIECLLAGAVLCAASVLTVTSPPSTMQNNDMAQPDSNTDMPPIMQDEFVRTLESQGVPITLVISPFITGFNNFTVNILGNNQSIDEVSNVSMEFRKSDLSLGPIFAELSKNNESSYSVNGGFLSQPGQWDLKVTIQRSNLYDLNYRLSFTVNDSSTSMHDQHNVESGQIEDNTNTTQSSMFTPMVIILSIIITALSTYFCMNAVKRLKIVQRSLGL